MMVPVIRSKDIKVLIDNPSIKNMEKLSKLLLKSKLTRVDPFLNKSINLNTSIKKFEKEIEYATKIIRKY